MQQPPARGGLLPLPAHHESVRLRAETGRCVWTIGSDNPRQFSILGGTPTSAWGPLERTDFGRGSIASENYASGLLTDPRPGAVAS